MATAPSKSYLQTLLLLILLTWSPVSSVIYKSIMWTTNNPFFQNHNKTGNKLRSECYNKELEIRVNLKSVLPVICPFEDLIMQKLDSQPSSGVLYENLWIVYDEESYKNCDVNLTATFGGGRKKLKNKLLYKCDTPDTLSKYFYRIDFKEDSPVSSDMYFEANTTYYFLATSDGQQNSLDRTSGGHCNNDGDKEIRMKFRVYVCGTNEFYIDPKCKDPKDIGVLKCLEPESPTASSPSAATTSIISPSPAVSTSHVSSSCENSESCVCSCPSMSYKWLASTVTTEKGNCKSSPASKGIEGGDDDMRTSRDKWMVIPIIFILLCIFILIVVIVVFYRLKKRYSVPCIYSKQISVAEPSIQEKTSDKNNLILVNSPDSNFGFDAEDGSKKIKNKDTLQRKDDGVAEKPSTVSTDKQTKSSNGESQVKQPRQGTLPDIRSKEQETSQSGVDNGDIESTADKQTNWSRGENQVKHPRQGTLPPIPLKEQEIKV